MLFLYTNSFCIFTWCLVCLYIVLCVHKQTNTFVAIISFFCATLLFSTKISSYYPSWYWHRYKQRRAELSEALTRLESVQSELEMFIALHSKCETVIAEVNGGLKEPSIDSKELEHMREQADHVQIQIHDMERVVS